MQGFIPKNFPSFMPFHPESGLQALEVAFLGGGSLNKSLPTLPILTLTQAFVPRYLHLHECGLCRVSSKNYFPSFLAFDFESGLQALEVGFLGGGSLNKSLPTLPILTLTLAFVPRYLHLHECGLCRVSSKKYFPPFWPLISKVAYKPWK